ncbi:hypothetical protein DCBHLPFO_00760 [Mycoplasmopsis arginini]|uniref:Uncharacterized protein n=1 Tax=Mycoplasmopsis arginini TaxID=2094 RepID=A0AA43QYM6_MYCAR|nr:hypothetical protein [Mycoplasmopsis arginini]
MNIKNSEILKIIELILTVSSLIFLLNARTLWRPATLEHKERNKIAKVVVLIPPPVDTGPAPINIKIVITSMLAGESVCRLIDE